MSPNEIPFQQAHCLDNQAQTAKFYYYFLQEGPQDLFVNLLFNIYK